MRARFFHPSCEYGREDERGGERGTFAASVQSFPFQILMRMSCPVSHFMWFLDHFVRIIPPGILLLHTVHCRPCTAFSFCLVLCWLDRCRLLRWRGGTPGRHCTMMRSDGMSRTHLFSVFFPYPHRSKFLTELCYVLPPYLFI